MTHIMTIEDVFFIKSRGLVVAGPLEVSSCPIDAIGEKLEIVGEDYIRESTMVDIEMFSGGVLDIGNPKRNVGIILSGLTKEDLAKGDKVYLISDDKDFNKTEKLKFISAQKKTKGN